MKRIIKGMCSAILSLSLLLPFTIPVSANQDVFYDDFTTESLDNSKWLIAHKQWGGNNNGVVKENVEVSNGTLKLKGLGDKYTGTTLGINKKNGKRTGGAIATKDYFASGSYEVRAKIAPDLGACSAIWTFEYEEYYPGEEGYKKNNGKGEYVTVNHEIDIEMPTANKDFATPSFQAARFNTWTTEHNYEANFTTLDNPQNDKEWHTYRFDWHTDKSNPRVEFYIDNQLVQVNTTNIPYKAGRLWLGVWFPKWAGNPDFEETAMEVDWVKITPYYENGDMPEEETYPNDGWAEYEDSTTPTEPTEPTEPTKPTEPTIPDEPKDQEENNELEKEDINKTNLIDNLKWIKTGNAELNTDPGYALLTSGSATDTIYQRIKVEKDTEYTLIADIETNQTEVNIGVRDYNGRYTELKETVSNNKTIHIPFKTAKHIGEIEVFAEVLRYQNINNPVRVSNMRLYKGITEEDINNNNPTPETPVNPQQPEPDQPTDKEPEIDKNNLLTDSNWTKSGSAELQPGYAVLTSGRDTDTINQKVKVEKGARYTLQADIETAGTEISAGVRDYNGRYTKLKETVSESGTITLTFETAKHIGEIEIFAEVLRYQNINNPVRVSNIRLYKGITEEEDIKNSNPTPETQRKLLR